MPPGLHHSNETVSATICPPSCGKKGDAGECGWDYMVKSSLKTKGSNPDALPSAVHGSHQLLLPAFKLVANADKTTSIGSGFESRRL